MDDRMLLEELKTHYREEPFVEYLEAISDAESLTPEEEAELIPRVAAGDTQARNRLVEANLIMAASVLREFPWHHVDLLDGAILANNALIRAVETYKPGASTLRDYAQAYIRRVLERGSLEEKPAPEAPAAPAASVTPEEIVAELREKLPQILEQMNPVEAKVLRFRLGVDGETPRSREDTAAHFGVSPERIRMVEQKAIRKARKMLMQRKRRGFYGVDD